MFAFVFTTHPYPTLTHFMASSGHSSPLFLLLYHTLPCTTPHTYLTHVPTYIEPNNVPTYLTHVLISLLYTVLSYPSHLYHTIPYYILPYPKPPANDLYQPSTSYLTLSHNILSYSTITTISYSYVPNPWAETTYQIRPKQSYRNNPGRIDPEPKRPVFTLTLQTKSSSVGSQVNFLSLQEVVARPSLLKRSLPYTRSLISPKTGNHAVADLVATKGWSAIRVISNGSAW